MSWAAIILAGGDSSRMGTPKALLQWKGETFLDRLIGVFGGSCSPVVAVVGAEAKRIEAGLARKEECRILVNPAPELGQLSSLQLALRTLEPCEGVFFTPVDSPGVSAETVRRLMERAVSGLVIPRQGGRNGHPVGLGWGLAAEFLALDPRSETARDVIHRHRGTTVYVDVEDPAIHLDIDDPATYRALTSERP